jgi:diguanylate cyclase (GGDEF)-like protein/PAS domain S-box-containing protein
VTSSDSSRVLQPLPAPGTGMMLDRFVAGYEGSGLSMSSTGIESLVSARKIPSAGWIAHMALPVEEAFAPIRAMARNAYGLATVLTLLTTLVMWALIRQTLKPLDKTTARIRAMATDNREIHTLELDGGREIQDLLTSFNTLVGQRKKTEEELRASQQFVQTTLDGLTAHICVLDKDGVILAVNRAWREFAAANEGTLLSIDEGANYPAACEAFTTGEDDEAARFAAGVKNVLAGCDDFFQMEYPCQSADQKRWFLARVSRLPGDDAVRVVVAHENITEWKLAEDAVKKSEKRLREAQQVAQLGSWELDLVTHALTWSDQIFEIFEIDSEKFGASYEAFIAAIHPEDRERVDRAFAHSVKNHLPYEIDHRLLLPDGTIKYVHERGETSYAPDGAPLRSAGTVQDVTLAALNQLALKESEERFRTIADYTYGWEYWQGLQGELLYISPSCRDITGYSREEFCSNKNLLYDIILPEDRAIMDSHVMNIHHEDAGSLDYRIMRKDGGICWIAHGCRAVYSKDGRFLGRRASNRDITDRKNAEAQVQQLAYFDTLTGLPNRRMLLDRLDQALSQAKRHERALAVMFLDLDNFKKINDTLGHDAGDELLKEVAVRLKTCVRSGDTVARQGGDEFIIVLAEITEPGDAARVAEKILVVLAAPVLVAEQALQATTSIGIAVYPVNGTDDVREILKKADKAMYEAKVAGRNGYRFFSD